MYIFLSGFDVGEIHRLVSYLIFFKTNHNYQHHLGILILVKPTHSLTSFVCGANRDKFSECIQKSLYEQIQEIQVTLKKECTQLWLALREGTYSHLVTTTPLKAT